MRHLIDPTPPLLTSVLQHLIADVVAIIGTMVSVCVWESDLSLMHAVFQDLVFGYVSYYCAMSRFLTVCLVLRGLSILQRSRSMKPNKYDFPSTTV